MKVYLHSFKTTLGVFRCASTEKGLALLTLPGESKTEFKRRLDKLFTDAQMITGGVLNKKVEQQIKTYLSGKLKRFDIKLDLYGPPFHQKALRQVAHIPYGQTRTYGEIARAAGNPRAYRAVGSANAGNNIPVIIPCHRVVAVNGLGGYGGGLAMKKKLLKLEGAL